MREDGDQPSSVLCGRGARADVAMMDDAVVGVRLEWNDPITLCYSAVGPLRRGQRVRVTAVDATGAAGEREGLVAIAPEQVVAAPVLSAAPRVVAVLPPLDDVAGPGGTELPPEVALLPADDAAIGPDELARALRLAALPLPEVPPERR